MNAHGGEAIRVRLLRVSGECEESFDSTSANAHGGEAVRVRLLRVSGESEESFDSTSANAHRGVRRDHDGRSTGFSSNIDYSSLYTPPRSIFSFQRCRGSKEKAWAQYCVPFYSDFTSKVRVRHTFWIINFV